MLSKRSRVCLAAGLCASGHLPSCAGFSASSPPRTTSLPLQAAFSSGSVHARTGSSVVRSRTTRVRSTVDVEPLVGVVETDTTTEVRRTDCGWVLYDERWVIFAVAAAVAPSCLLRHTSKSILMKNRSMFAEVFRWLMALHLVKKQKRAYWCDRTTVTLDCVTRVRCRYGTNAQSSQDLG